MTSSNGNIFCVTGPLCGEFTCHRWIPLTKGCVGVWVSSLIYAWINGWVNNREAGDLRRHRAHYDVTVMCSSVFTRFFFYQGLIRSCLHGSHELIKICSISLTDQATMATFNDLSNQKFHRSLWPTVLKLVRQKVINTLCVANCVDMMTPLNGNIFRVTGPLCREFTCEFHSQRPVERSFDAFFHLCLNKRLSNRQAGDLRCHRANYDVIVMNVDEVFLKRCRQRLSFNTLLWMHEAECLCRESNYLQGGRYTMPHWN